MAVVIPNEEPRNSITAEESSLLVPLISDITPDGKLRNLFITSFNKKNPENKINQIVQDNNLLQVKFMKQQRLFTQFNLLYKDMFTYYSVMSQLCQVKIKYETDVKNFKFGNNQDWQAILGYYEYLISLLQVMAPKAVQVVPKNAANIQNVYKNLINEIQGEINELSMAPLKQMYGGGR
jgi:hypothetical protein